MTKQEIIFFRPCNAFSAVWCLIAHPGGALSPSHSQAAQWEVLAWEKTPHSCSQWETSAELYLSPGTAPQIPSAKALCSSVSVHTCGCCVEANLGVPSLAPGMPLLTYHFSSGGPGSYTCSPLEILPWTVSRPHCSVQCLLSFRANCNSPLCRQSRSLSLLLATKANFSPPTQSRK